MGSSKADEKAKRKAVASSSNHDVNQTTTAQAESSNTSIKNIKRGLRRPGLGINGDKKKKTVEDVVVSSAEVQKQGSDTKRGLQQHNVVNSSAEAKKQSLGTKRGLHQNSHRAAQERTAESEAARLSLSEPQVGAVAVQTERGRFSSGSERPAVDTSMVLEPEISVPASDPVPAALEAGLVQARAVDNNSSRFLPQAEEVDKAYLEEETFKKSKRKECRQTGYVIIAVSLVVLAIGLGLGLGRRKETNKEIRRTESPTEMLSLAPTAEAPLDLLLDTLPPSSVEQIQIFGTPQRKAFDWLANHKKVHEFPKWRKQQLFALATFYHSFEGPNWLGGTVNTHWLDEDKDECDWFSGEYGTLCDEQGYKEGARHGVDACNNSQFLALSLVCMRLEDLAPTMPPEIALLTSLQIIELAENGIHGNLHDMLPSTLYNMTSLQKLYIEGNHLTGTLPTQLGNFPSLWKLDIFNNHLKSTIPSQLGRISTLVRLSLQNNDMTGTIPTQFGMWKTPHTISLFNNSFTGPIPSQLGQISTKLQWLHLQNNDLTGSIPTQLGNVTWLSELRLSNNPLLTGAIPSQLGLLPLLEEIDLSHLPLLSGSIPGQLSGLSRLSHLNIQASPGLTGSIPSDFCPLLNEVCGYDSVSEWHDDDTYKWRSNNCSLSFDCSATLCGCDCECPV